MNPNIEKFSAAIANDPELQAKVQAIHADAAKAAAADLADLSREVGTPFTGEEFLASAAATTRELSEEELGAVAGGAGWKADSPTNVMASLFSLGLMCAISGILTAAAPEVTNCQPKDWR